MLWRNCELGIRNEELGMAAFLSVLVVFIIADLIDLVKSKRVGDYVVYFILTIAAAVGGCLYFYYINADSFVHYVFIQTKVGAL